MLAEINLELGDMVDAIDRHGGRYAKAYIDWVLDGGRPRQAPAPPRELSASVAKAIREMVLDAALYRRVAPVRLR